MNWENKPSVESVMSVETKNLKNCTKDMVREFHNKTIYECKNVTKTHCTTLWTVDQNGEKVWAGNEDDCKDVTWEECFPIVKQVPMQVAQMNCIDYPVSYFDYENVTSTVMADTMDCQVEKIPECHPVTSTKCDNIVYTRCEELPQTICTTVEIPVPSQQKLHKQWCLFDNEENIDFDRQVRRITELANEEHYDSEIIEDFDPIFADYSQQHLEAAAPLPIAKRENQAKKQKVNYQKRNQHLRARGGRKSL